MLKFFRDIWYFRYTVEKSWPHAVASAFWASRLGMAVHVLIGRPIAYRLKLEDGAMVFDAKSRAIVQECLFINSPDEGIRVEGFGMGG